MAEPGLRLEQLRQRTFNNTALMNELLDLFRTEAAAALGRLSAAMAAGDAAAAKAVTHRFKSSAATIGATRLAGLLAEAETAFAAGTVDHDRLQAINAEAARCIAQATVALAETVAQ